MFLACYSVGVLYLRLYNIESIVMKIYVLVQFSAVMIAGYTSQYVSTMLEQVASGDKTGGVHQQWVNTLFGDGVVHAHIYQRIKGYKGMPVDVM